MLIRLTVYGKDEEVWVNPAHIVMTQRVDKQTRLTLTAKTLMAGSPHPENTVIGVWETPEKIVEKIAEWPREM